MSTFFFRKNLCWMQYLVIGLLVTLSILLGYFCINYQILKVNKDFYFLVSTNANVEASTHFIENMGGAGYLLCEKNNQYVVVSVYLKQADGVSVQTSLREEDFKLITVSAKNIIIKRKDAKTINEGLQNFYNCIQILNQEIYRLSSGGTQESCKRILTILSNQLRHLAKTYKELNTGLSNAFKNAEKQINDQLNGIIFAKDLRGVLCEFCVAFMNVCKREDIIKHF